MYHEKLSKCEASEYFISDPIQVIYEQGVAKLAVLGCIFHRES